MPRLSLPAILCALALGALAATAPPAAAQALFGKNKVTYDRREWLSLRTEHCEIFYYREEEHLARQVAAMAESTSVEYDTTFAMRPRNRIPILTYASHQAFQQSHAASGFIGEGTGGLTELIRGRVLIPHNGSMARLRWVTRHELVHAYMIEKISQAQKKKGKYRASFPPLWFTEGLAEHIATTWDSDAEGLLQDAVISGVATLMTESWSIEGTVLMYKEGQSFLDYMALQPGGRRRIMDLFEHWTEFQSFPEIWEKTFERPLVDCDKEWFDFIRKKYYPRVATRRPVREYARTLTCCDQSYNLAPTVLHQAPGDSTVRIAYLRAEDGAVDLRLRTERAGRTVSDERLLRSGNTAKFESFHFFRSRLGVSRDDRIALVSQRGGADVLHIYDLKTREVVATWSFPGIVGLSSPAWLAGDSALVVVGQAASGQSDLYRVRAVDGAMTPLTNDAAQDDDPSGHPTRNLVAFASDREGGVDGTSHLFTLDLDSGALTQLTSGEHNERHPAYSPDGSRIAFLSDREGIADLYLWEDGRTQRASRFLGPSYDPAWRPDGKAIVFAGQAAWEFHIYEVPIAPVDTLWLAEAADRMRLGPPAMPVATEPAELYRRRLGLDVAQSVVALDPALGSTGAGGLVALSDVLGAEGYSIFLANSSSSLSGFLDGMEVGVTYFNRAQRLNYGVGAFRLTTAYNPELDLFMHERRVGGSLLASYPLDKFRRIEASAVLRYAENHWVNHGDFRDMWLLSNFVAYVHDDARFTYYGPAGGTRWNITGGYTRDLSTGIGDSFTLLTDVRKYVTIVPDVVWAVRVVAEGSFGDDQGSFYFGGPYSVRGYDRRTIGGTKGGFVQTEVRLPILSRFRMGVPAPIEFPRLSIALMADAGVAGDIGEPFQRIGAAGLGIFVGGGYFPVLRLDILRRTDFRSLEDRNVTRFTIGYNF